MRPAFKVAAALVVLALLPAACNKKPASDAPAQTAAKSADGPGVPGPRYDTSQEANQKFLADYAALPGVTKTADGMLYRILKSGSGKMPQRTDDQVTVTYKGQLINGTVFDQTHPEEPNNGAHTFTAGMLIPGWIEALAKMKEGDTWELVLPYPLAYGEEGHPPVIPQKQTLVFQMSLLKVEPGQ
jgi:FKBP-type peptidyl-prolyl cis-trans isomerase FklB